jgi:hypothetical protein
LHSAASVSAVFSLHSTLPPHANALQMEQPVTLPSVRFRAAGKLEPTPDLQHPNFDNNTLPLLFSPNWQENFGEPPVLCRSMCHSANNEDLLHQHSNFNAACCNAQRFTLHCSSHPWQQRGMAALRAARP